MKCKKCGKSAATIDLPYMKRKLCESCFLGLFEKRVRRTIRKSKLVGRDDRMVGVALSGGKDSLSVLKILHNLYGKIPHCELVAISIDEGIGEKKKSLEISKKICQKKGIEHFLFSFREEYGLSLPGIMKRVKKLDNPAPACSYCRILRRNLINKKSQEIGLDKIATGHNLDDEIQAAMMNFIRGDYDHLARAESMVGIISDRRVVPRVKPLRECPENEVITYATINKLPFFDKNCLYSEDAFHRTIREVIGKIDEKHPGSKFQLLHSLDNLVPIVKKQIKGGKVKSCKSCGARSSGDICRVCQVRQQVGF